MSDSREEHLHEETSQVASFAHLQQELAVFQREIMFPQDHAVAKHTLIEIKRLGIIS